jgi:hypothetical protein
MQFLSRNKFLYVIFSLISPFLSAPPHRLIHLKSLLIKVGSAPPCDIWILRWRSSCWIFTEIGPLCYNCMPEVSMLIKTDKPNRSEAARWSFITLVIWTSDLRDVGNAICCYFHSYLRNFSDNYLWAQRLSLRRGSALQKLLALSFSSFVPPAILSKLTAHSCTKRPPHFCNFNFELFSWLVEKNCT